MSHFLKSLTHAVFAISTFFPPFSYLNLWKAGSRERHEREGTTGGEINALKCIFSPTSLLPSLVSSPHRFYFLPLCPDSYLEDKIGKYKKGVGASVLNH